jgi:hypothetical protein
VHGDSRIDQIAAQRPESRKDTILVRGSKTAVADNIRTQNCRELANFRHGASAARKLA